ncbi:MAG TPA: C-type lectin domain-containing protein [Polyangiaceae bacterium]|nr:C-type lectin domain-containing protein [Polyangiaceae bacterium]
MLPGCPLSDAYFVDPNAGHGTGGGDLGGTGGTDSGKAGQEPAGRGGRSGPGGKSGGGAPAAGTGGAVASGTGGSSGSSMKCEAMERCDGLDNDCNDEIDEGDACPASCSAQQYDGHAYVLCLPDDAIVADQAAMRCAEMGKGPAFTLDLAWIEASDENEFLREWIADTAPSDGVVWMGATDQTKEGVWVWGRRPDAEQFYEVTKASSGPYMDRFSDFGQDQPGSSRGLDEDCGAFDARVDWHWSDRECSEAMVGYVCEQTSP